MRNHKHAKLLIIILFATTVTTATAAFYRQTQSDKQRKFDKDEFESQYPIVDYSAPESTDPIERTRRKAKSKKYNNKGGAIDPYSDSTFVSSDWAIGLPALPVNQSDVVIVGEVTDAKAYLSEDKNSVYSEFTVTVNDVLKNLNDSPLISNSQVIVERQGGRVRFPSGHINIVVIGGQGMPRPGRRYLLFLKRNDDGQDFSINVGYELRGGRVVLLDEAYPGHPITTYKGTVESSFLNEVRDAIANSPKG